MARYIGMDEVRVFRAVFEITYLDGRTTTSAMGPYSTAGQAKAQLTRETRRIARYSRYSGMYSEASVRGWVEWAHLDWQRS